MSLYANKNTYKNFLIATFLIFLSTLQFSLAKPTAPEAGAIHNWAVGGVYDKGNHLSEAGGTDPEPGVEENLPAADSVRLNVTTVASHLDVAWEIAWGPDNWIWFTEQSGAVSKVNPETGEQKLLLRVLPDVYRNRTLGLLCMAIHPDIENFPYVFLNYTYMKGPELLSRWVRYTYDEERLVEPLTLLEIPAAAGHNGSRIVFAPDGTLMLATGDADPKNDEANSGISQDMNSLSGKILRINIDGSVPDDNPFPGSPIWALGFRVPQGLVYASNGKLYSAEHGFSTNDEVNLIEKGANYGYPYVIGVCDRPEEEEFCAKHNVKEPLMAWTPTIAPAGLDYYDHAAIPQWQNSLLLVTLKGQSLRVLQLNEQGDAVQKEQVFFEKEFGRLRDVCVSPEGDVYLSTSNRDWNPVEGFPLSNDDRIIKISANKTQQSPAKPVKEEKVQAAAPKKAEAPLHQGALVYNNYCASCHKADGTGIAGTFPPLKGAEQVKGDKKDLIRIVLHGLSGPITVLGKQYDMEMPAFGFLSDQDVADVVDYVRSAFANIEEKTSATEVKALRTK